MLIYGLHRKIEWSLVAQLNNGAHESLQGCSMFEIRSRESVQIFMRGYITALKIWGFWVVFLLGTLYIYAFINWLKHKRFKLLMRRNLQIFQHWSWLKMMDVPSSRKLFVLWNTTSCPRIVRVYQCSINMNQLHKLMVFIHCLLTFSDCRCQINLRVPWMLVRSQRKAWGKRTWIHMYQNNVAFSCPCCPWWYMTVNPCHTQS